ncbi:MAG: serine hydrolase [Xanthomonadaceae bacterium]|nr:serine hydrolase [Xanthomonadaceae bacterium]
MPKRESELKLKVMDGLGFNLTMAVIAQAIEEKVAPSIAIGVWSAVRADEAFVAGVGAGVNLHSVFDLASVSKVMGTMAAVAYLIEKRVLNWDTQVQSVLPEYPDGEAKLIHLVSHTAGWVWWKPFWEELRAQYPGKQIETIPVIERQQNYFEMISKLKPEHKVGENCTYSDVSMMWVQFVIEKLTNKPLDVLLEKIVWPWMGIESAYYQRIDKPGIANTAVIPTEDCLWRGRRLQGVVHDDNCYVMGGYAGHAGVFGEVSAPLWFGRRILTGFFDKDVMRGFFRRVARPSHCTRTAGFDTPSGDNPSIGRYFSDASIGHLGYTGTSLWIDPINKIVVTLLTNRVYYSRENEKIKIFRPMIHNELALDLKALGLMA